MCWDYNSSCVFFVRCYDYLYFLLFLFFAYPHFVFLYSTRRMVVFFLHTLYVHCPSMQISKGENMAKKYAFDKTSMITSLEPF